MSEPIAGELDWSLLYPEEIAAVSASIRGERSNAITFILTLCVLRLTGNVEVVNVRPDLN